MGRAVWQRQVVLGGKGVLSAGVHFGWLVDGGRGSQCRPRAEEGLRPVPGGGIQSDTPTERTRPGVPHSSPRNPCRSAKCSLIWRAGPTGPTWCMWGPSQGHDRPAVPLPSP